FKEHGLPGDLYYVGLIESGYNTYIRSRASAVGPWQFIKGTATRYGLRVDRYVDERTNLIKATHAAASYFKDLYNIFGSWELALCAYNAGEYRIINVIRKGNTRDYRKLVELKLLPKETVYYIPKVAAAKYLADNPSRYGFVINDSASSEFAKVKFHRVPHSFNTRDVLKSLNVSQSEFKKLNPDIKNSYVRVTKRRSYRLLIPEHKTLGSLRKARPSSRDIASSTAAVHKVRSGENLSRIAKRYGLGVSKLKRLNGLRSNKIFVGQRLKTGRAVTQKASRSVASRNKETHVVRSGENLSTIARKYSTSVGTLKNFNKLRSSKIFVGQKLRVPASNSRFYTVRKGDNLYKIAKRHGVSLQRLKRFNKMKSGKIFPGQRLQIPLEG
ncbi:MAG: LysM peptidoglycan-binding domain-containing protein, partial [Bacteriovoracaceae bacterium]